MVAYESQLGLTRAMNDMALVPQVVAGICDRTSVCVRCIDCPSVRYC